LSESEFLGGYVTSPKMFIGKNNKIDENGLFSQKIFGPINNNKCACGKLSFSLDAGKVCDKCGVICGSNDLRLKTFGKIKMYCYVINPTEIDKVIKLVGNKYKNLFNTLHADANSSLKIYLNITINGQKMFLSETFNESGSFSLPLRITGLYSLIVAFRYIKDTLIGHIEIANKVKKLFDDNIIFNTLKVLPPMIRPATFDPKKANTIRITEINKHYTSILQLNKSQRMIDKAFKLDEEELFKNINENFTNQTNVDLTNPTIVNMDQLNYKYQYYIQLIYGSAIDLISGKKGLIRSSLLSRTIEFSARSVIVINPALESYQINVSKNILWKLWRPYFIHFLTTKKNVDYDFCFENIITRDDYIVSDDYNEFLNWMMENEQFKKRLLFMNRQPTLWSHGIPVVEVIPSEDNDDTIAISPLILSPMNADFDGDTIALYALHSKKALNEMAEKAFFQNRIYYERENKFLLEIRHEALFSLYLLTENCNQQFHDQQKIEIPTLQDLEEDIENYNNLNKQVFIKDINLSVTYGVALLNKWCKFNEIKINIPIQKKNSEIVVKTIYENSVDNKDFHKTVSKLERLLLIFSSVSKFVPTINISRMETLRTQELDKLFNNLPSNNIELGFLLNSSLVNRSINNLDNNSILYKLYKSGSRFSKTQLARSCINIGYVSDDHNKIYLKPIKNNLLNGLNENDFFISSPGTRKGIADKSVYTKKSGYLQRTAAIALSVLRITEEDCGTEKHLKIKIINRNHADTLIGKYYKLSESFDDWKIMDKKTAIENVGKEILIRSPMTCQTPNLHVCQKCFGDRKFPTKEVGLIAAKNLTERLTQLTMRTFHESGSANIKIDKNIEKFIEKKLIDIKYENDIIILIFNSCDIPEQFSEIYGFLKREDNKLFFENNQKDKSDNKDAISTLIEINNFLKNEKCIIKTPAEYYLKLTEFLLDVAKIYSSFIELLFANIFIVDYKKRIFWRYNQEKTIEIKIGIRMLAKYISPILALLYEPNKKTIKDIPEKLLIDLNKKNSIELINSNLESQTCYNWLTGLTTDFQDL